MFAFTSLAMVSSAAMSRSGSALVSSIRRPLASRAAVRAVVKAGDKLPDVTLFEGQPEYAKAEEVKLGELTSGKTAVIFAVPGAFTPGCSKSHLPSFVEKYDELVASGVDHVVCTATNDPYVMEAWGRASGVKDGTIKMLSDKNAELCRALGVASESDVMVRSERYAMVVKDGVVTSFLPATQADGSKVSEVTYAPSVLSALKG